MNRAFESKILFWLSLPMITVKRQAEIIRLYGSAEKLWNEFGSHYDDVVKICGERSAEELRRYKSESFIDKCIDKLRKDGISVITVLNPVYPERLFQPEVSAPSVLYYKGDINLLSTECVAVVGTRACTSYGKEAAKIVATDLAENGVTVVSGMATGIDSYAHAATLDAGGKTIAVLGSGLNKISPAGNAKLYDRILESGGLIISEYKPNADATKYTFPERNRIISGLSHGVVVVEAAEKSGALITARYAAEQNREVFAVPGNITSSRSKGCLDLIRDGATIIRNGLDVLESLKLMPKKSSAKTEIIVDKDEKKLYSLLEDGAKSIDELIENSGFSPMELSEILLRMELAGVIEKESAATYAIKRI